jgi:hypothetical protein
MDEPGTIRSRANPVRYQDESVVLRIGPSRPELELDSRSIQEALDIQRLADYEQEHGPGQVLLAAQGEGIYVKPHMRHGTPIKGFWRKGHAAHVALKDIGDSAATGKSGFEQAQAHAKKHGWTLHDEPHMVPNEHLKQGDVVMYSGDDYWHDRNPQQYIRDNVHKFRPAHVVMSHTGHGSVATTLASGELGDTRSTGYTRSNDQPSHSLVIGHMPPPSPHPDDVPHSALKPGETYAYRGHQYTRASQKTQQYEKPGAKRGGQGPTPPGYYDTIHDPHAEKGYENTSGRHDMHGETVRRIKPGTRHTSHGGPWGKGRYGD